MRGVCTAVAAGARQRVGVCVLRGGVFVVALVACAMMHWKPR